MFLTSYRNHMLCATLVVTIVSAEIGSYALYEFHIPHMDTHNHPYETAPQTFSMTHFMAAETTGTAAISGDSFKH